MCMPMGAIIAFKGIENTMVIIHGSQGCATYMRRHMAEHFNEPIDVASSSITEKGTIYGGEANLKQGLENLTRLYNPQLVGILSTCLAETIGEDIERTAAEFRRAQGESDSPMLVAVPTPGFGDSHTEGYFQALRSIVQALCKKTESHRGINVIVPHISPADVRELKRILEMMQVSYTLLPDISDTLDSPYAKTYNNIPAGGTPLKDIEAMAGAQATIQFGETLRLDLSPGVYLHENFSVPLFNLPLPMGIVACDQLLKLLQNLTGNPVPDLLRKERGRLLDAMVDSHKYNREGRAAVFGEPETVYGVGRVLVENGLLPAILATGSRSSQVAALLGPLTGGCDEEPLILVDSDFSQISSYCAAKEINLAIGSSDGRLLSEHEGIPLVRLGFPIHDRIGGQRILSLGYTGTTMFLDQITNTLLNSKLSRYRQDLFQRFYPCASNEGR